MWYEEILSFCAAQMNLSQHCWDVHQPRCKGGSLGKQSEKTVLT